MKNLERFLQAQEKSYEIAYQEIKNGRKEGHWIWYIFPQIQGLGESATSFYYGIQNLNEAKEYLENPILHDRLIEISNALLSLSGKSASEILGTLDAIKVRSSMTLFSKADPNEKVFAKGDDFGGMGEAFLSVLEERLIPMGESRLAFSVRRRGIAGYSLAGLFAVYAMGRSDRFSLVGSMSGSLWFDGFLEYALETPISPAVKRLYLSLGDKEKKSRNPRMARVETCTGKLAEIWGKETAVRYEKNPGNHFQDPQGRMAKGLDWLSEGCA